MGFVDKNEFAVFGKMFYDDKDIIITGIVDRVLRFR